MYSDVGSKHCLAESLYASFHVVHGLVLTHYLVSHRDVDNVDPIQTRQMLPASALLPPEHSPGALHGRGDGL